MRLIGVCTLKLQALNYLLKIQNYAIYTLYIHTYPFFILIYAELNCLIVFMVLFVRIEEW
jgi:hypothetical protein